MRPVARILGRHSWFPGTRPLSTRLILSRLSSASPLILDALTTSPSLNAPPILTNHSVRSLGCSATLSPHDLGDSLHKTLSSQPLVSLKKVHSLSIALAPFLPSHPDLRPILLRALGTLARGVTVAQLSWLDGLALRLAIYSPSPDAGPGGLAPPELRALLSAYARLGRRYDASAAMKAFPSPKGSPKDPLTYELFLSAVLQSGQVAPIMDAYRVLRRANCTLSLRLYRQIARLILQARGPRGADQLLGMYAHYGDIPGAGAVYEASKVLQEELKGTLSQGVPHYITPKGRSFLVITYLRCGEARVASTLLEGWKEVYTGDESPDPPSHLIIMTLQALAQIRDPKSALSLLRALRDQGVDLDVQAYTVVLEGFARCADPAKALGLLKEMVRSNPSLVPDHWMWTTVLRAHAYAGDIYGAEKILRNHILPSATSDTLQHAYAPLLYARLWSGDQEAVQALLDEMSRRGIHLGDVGLHEMIRAFSHSAQPEKAVSLYNLLARVPGRRDLKQGIKVTEKSVNALLFAHARAGNLEGALDALRDMAALGIDPNSVTENALIVLFSRRKDPESAELILKELSSPPLIKPSSDAKDSDRSLEKPLIPTAFIYGPLMAAYSAAGDIAGAESVFSRILASGIQPTTAIFNILIAQRARQHDLAGALQVYEQMPTHGCIPTALTYALLIQALVASGKRPEGEGKRKQRHMEGENEGTSSGLQDAERVYRSAGPGTLAPAGPSPFNALMSGYMREGREEEARRVYGEMLHAGVSPDGLTYTLLMGAFARHGNAQGATAIFREMRGRGFEPDSIHYSVLINAYGWSGDTEGADAVAGEWMTRSEGQIDSVSKVMWSTLISSRRGRFWEALEVWKAACQQKKPSPHGFAILANTVSADMEHILQAQRDAAEMRKVKEADEQERDRRRRILSPQSRLEQGVGEEMEWSKGDVQEEDHGELGKGIISQCKGDDRVEALLVEWNLALESPDWSPSGRNANQMAAALLRAGRMGDATRVIGGYLRAGREDRGLSEEDEEWGVAWWVAVAASNLLQQLRHDEGPQVMHEVIERLEVECPELLRRIERGQEA